MYDYDDDGTMPNNVADLESAIVGHRIVKVDRDLPAGRSYWGGASGIMFTLDTGAQVILRDTSDCCAYTELQNVIEHLDTVDHIVTNVTPDEDYNTWHIFADLGEILELQIGWSCGNPFYYGYGFDIEVVDV